MKNCKATKVVIVEFESRYSFLPIVWVKCVQCYTNNDLKAIFCALCRRRLVHGNDCNAQNTLPLPTRANRKSGYPLTTKLSPTISIISGGKPKFTKAINKSSAMSEFAGLLD